MALKGMEKALKDYYYYYYSKHLIWLFGSHDVTQSANPDPTLLATPFPVMITCCSYSLCCDDEKPVS